MRLHRGWKVAGGALAAISFVMVGAVSGVWASHSFTDVPDSNPFHDQIAAINDACIGGGFPDGTYRPGNNVTRQAMAAFLARTGSESYLGYQMNAVNFGADGLDDSPKVDVASVSVTVPDLPGCEQHVVLDGSGFMFTNSAGAVACHLETTGVCNGYLSLWEGAAFIGQAFLRLNNDLSGTTLHVTAVVWAAPGVHTYTLKANSWQVKPNQGMVTGGQLIATRMPFGPAPVAMPPLSDGATTAAVRGGTP